ncbi:formyltransferase family protein [Streptomyces sp. NPDC006879]|uniref:formyltransferase family protein n=1 Tax=Streptomyces sp. NPDC006879 TaxID=3364767 RepID=UPI0036CC8910
MIFIGEGALLRRAVRHAASHGHTIDLVCSPDPQDASGSRHLSTPDINEAVDTLLAASEDGIVWSLNNKRILRAPLLTSGLRFFNVHNGLLPQHRGLPAVAVLFALLGGQEEYGATLHEIDEGIDTGTVLAQRRFPVAPDARYHQVMLRGIQSCHALFQDMLPAVARNEASPPLHQPTAEPAYYGRRTLEHLGDYRDHPAFARATDLGPFAAHTPEVSRAVAALRRG